MVFPTPKLPNGGVTDVVLRHIHYLGVSLLVRYSGASISVRVAVADADAEGMQGTAPTILTVTHGFRDPIHIVAAPPVVLGNRVNSVFVLIKKCVRVNDL